MTLLSAILTVLASAFGAGAGRCYAARDYDAMKGCLAGLFWTLAGPALYLLLRDVF